MLTNCKTGLLFLSFLVAYQLPNSDAYVFAEGDSGYGERCNSTQLCDSTADLTCSTEEICGCAVPDSMVFDTDQGKCVSLTGLSGSCFMQPMDGYQRTCTQNAECHFRPIEDISTPSLIGYCKCAIGYADYADRTCGDFIVTQPFGARCNASHYCHRPSILRCNDSEQIDGDCECIIPDRMEFDEDSGSCLSLVVPESICQLQPVGGIQIKCTANAECISDIVEDPSGISGFCNCASGYEELTGGTCVRIPSIGSGYGEYCNSTELCNPAADLTCSAEEICICSEPDYMIYDDDQGKCVSLAGLEGSCYFEAIGDVLRSCVKNSECTFRPDDSSTSSPFGYCKCTAGYVAYEDRTCGMYVTDQPFGDRCNASHYCNAGSILQCSDLLDGQCQCTYPETMAFHGESGICLSLADPESSCYLEPIGGIQMRCIENADCIANPEDASGISGHCSCSETYAAYEDRTCGIHITSLPFGQSCNSSHTCDKSAILDCDAEGICACLPGTGTFYEESNEACVSFVGADSKCYLKPIEDIQIECSKNSGCLPHVGEDSDVGYCTCLPGFAPYKNNTCGIPKMDQKHGEICNATWSCDADDLLLCDTAKEMCACKYKEDSYSETLERCVSPAGGLCFNEVVNGEIRSCIEPLNCTLLDYANGLPYGKCSCGEGYAADEENDRICVLDNSGGVTLVVPVIFLLFPQIFISL